LSEIPRSPAPFFERYVPEHMAKLGGAFEGRSSPGAIAFDVTGAGSWSLRLANGSIDVSTGVAADALFRVTLAESAFEPVLVRGAERLGEEAGLERQLVAVRALVLDDDRVRMLKESRGTLAVKLASPGGEHQLLLSLGAGVPAGPADCELACALEDLWALQSGAKNPFELLMDGKVKLTGNVQLAMVLGAALG
jgi:hypothetical protein